VTLNLWRGKQRKASASMETAPLDKLPEAAIADPAEEFWEADYNQFLTRRALEIMRDEFQPNTWKAFWATVVDEKPVADVAKELGMSTTAVYAARHRVKGRLEEELAGLRD
jgi:RNA polymerase sigma-70 factor (ECF subfamily)